VSEPSSSKSEVLPHWRAGRLALVVIGIEVFVLACILMLRMDFGLLPYGVTAAVAGGLLAVTGIIIRCRDIVGQRGKARRWTEGSAASFILGLLVLVPSGLCTSVGGLYAIDAADQEPAKTRREIESQFIMAQVIGQVLIVGGISMAVGFGFVFAGLKARQRD
jgi:hypothetical protein